MMKVDRYGSMPSSVRPLQGQAVHHGVQGQAPEGQQHGAAVREGRLAEPAQQALQDHRQADAGGGPGQRPGPGVVQGVGEDVQADEAAHRHHHVAIEERHHRASIAQRREDQRPHQQRTQARPEEHGLASEKRPRSQARGGPSCNWIAGTRPLSAASGRGSGPG